MWPITAHVTILGNTLCILKQALRPKHIVDKRLPISKSIHARSLSGNEPNHTVVKKQYRTEWTDDYVERLKTALAAGKTDKQCYKLFPDLSERSVRGQRLKLGLLRRRPTTEVERVLGLVAQHLTVSQIRDKMPHLTGKLHCLYWLWRA